MHTIVTSAHRRLRSLKSLELTKESQAGTLPVMPLEIPLVVPWAWIVLLAFPVGVARAQTVGRTGQQVSPTAVAYPKMV